MLPGKIHVEFWSCINRHLISDPNELSVQDCMGYVLTPIFEKCLIEARVPSIEPFIEYLKEEPKESKNEDKDEDMKKSEELLLEESTDSTNSFLLAETRSRSISRKNNKLKEKTTGKANNSNDQLGIF